VVVEHLGGAVARVGQDATAFGDRTAPHSLIITGEWVDPAESEQNIRWVRDCWEAVRPYAKETVYVNYVDAGDDARFEAAYGANYERLAALKATYDPTNFFRHNHNVKPAISAT
jgi:FAD/FMN-containing dehydrogenase